MTTLILIFFSQFSHCFCGGEILGGEVLIPPFLVMSLAYGFIIKKYFESH